MSASIKQLFQAADIKVTAIWNEAKSQISQKTEYQKFGFKESDATNYETTIQNFTGFGPADATGEQEPYNLDDVEAAGFVTLRPEKFTKGFVVSEEMIRFSRWDDVTNATMALQNSMNQRIDINVAKILSRGFDTTFFAGPNGEALFTATHTMKDATAQSNYLGAVPLSYDNLKTAVQTLDTQYDDKGVRLLNGNRKLLVVSQYNKHKAIEILKSIGNPDTANRVSNVWMTLEGEIELLVSNYIDENNTASKKFNWFVIDTQRASEMTRIIWGWKPRINTENVITNGTKIYEGSLYFKAGWSSFQFAVGSNSLS